MAPWQWQTPVAFFWRFFSWKGLFLAQSVDSCPLLDDAVSLSPECCPSQAEISAVTLVLSHGASHGHQEKLVLHLVEGRITRAWFSCIPIYFGYCGPNIEWSFISKEARDFPETVPSELYKLLHPNFSLGAAEVILSASLHRGIVQETLRKILASQSGKCWPETAKGHGNVGQEEMDRAALEGSKWLGPGDFLNAVEPGSSRGAGKWIWELPLVSDRWFSWAWWLEMTQVRNGRTSGYGQLSRVVLGKAELPQLRYLLKTGITWGKKILSLPIPWKFSRKRAGFAGDDVLQVWVLWAWHEDALRLLALAKERQQRVLSWAVTFSRGWATPGLLHPRFLNSDVFVKSCLQFAPARFAGQRALLKAKKSVQSIHRETSNTMKKTWDFFF